MNCMFYLEMNAELFDECDRSKSVMLNKTKKLSLFSHPTKTVQFNELVIMAIKSDKC